MIGNSYTSYKDPNVNMTVTYKVEYVDDERDWQRIVDEDVADPWTLYKSEDFDDAGEAVLFFMTRFFPVEKCYDVKLWEDIQIDGKTVLQNYIDLPSSSFFSLGQAINKKATDGYFKYQKELSDAAADLAAYEDFVKAVSVPVGGGKWQKGTELFTQWLAHTKKELRYGR